MAYFYRVTRIHVALALFTSNTPGGEKLKLQCFDIGKNSILVKGLGDQFVTNIQVYLSKIPILQIGLKASQ